MRLFYSGNRDASSYRPRLLTARRKWQALDFARVVQQIPSRILGPPPPRGSARHHGAVCRAFIFLCLNRDARSFLHAGRSGHASRLSRIQLCGLICTAPRLRPQCRRNFRRIRARQWRDYSRTGSCPAAGTCHCCRSFSCYWHCSRATLVFHTAFRRRTRTCRPHTVAPVHGRPSCRHHRRYHAPAAASQGTCFPHVQRY